MKALSIFVSLLFCVSAHAANVRLYFQSNTNAATFDTNYLVATPISSNILASGGVKPIGLPFRIANPSGVVTQSFNLGWYSISNGMLGKGVVINIWDSSSALYDLTNVIRSGFNTYQVTVYGTNPPPTFDEVTNAVAGYYAPSNGLFTASNFLYSIASTATNTGITAATATNISANQSLIVSNGLGLRLLATNALNLAATVTNSGGFATNLTIKAVGASSTKAVSVYGVDGSEYFYVTDESAFLPNIASASDAVLIGVNSEGRIVKALNNTFTNNTVVSAINATNIYGAGLTTMTNAAVTVVGSATNNLAIAITNRYNAADTVVSNGLSARLIATNSAILATVTNLDIVTSNGVIAATFNQTNAYKVRAIAAGSGVTVTTNASDGLYTIDASAGAGGGIPTANGSGTNTTLKFVSANWGTNGTLTGSAVILSGVGNTIASSSGSLVVGGKSNYIGGIGLGENNVIGGGFANEIPGYNNSQSVIAGGLGNRIFGATSEETISGGYSNSITSIGGVSARATVSGGYKNQAIDVGATIPGGYSNYAVRASFAAGTKAQAANRGSFVWADDSGNEFTTTQTNQFLIRSLNGVGINTNNPGGNALRVIGQTATDDLAIGNRLFSQLTTNVIAVTNAGTASANGTYRLVNSSHYTNDFTGSVITNNTSGNWQIKNGTTVLYSSTTPAGSTWTVQSGSSPAAISLFGSYLYTDGVVVRGVISSTNLDARFVSGSIAATIAATNAAWSNTNGTTSFVGDGAGLTNLNHRTGFTNGSAVFGKFNIIIGDRPVSDVNAVSNSVLLVNQMGANFIGDEVIFIGARPNSGGAEWGAICIGSGAGGSSGAIAIGQQYDVFSTNAIGIGNSSALDDAPYSIQIGFGLHNYGYTNSIAIGQTQNSKDNQTIIGNLDVVPSGNPATSETHIGGVLYANGAGITNLPVQYAQLVGSASLTAQAAGNVITNYSTAETTSGFSASAANGTITNASAGTFEINVRLLANVSANPGNFYIRTNGVNTHLNLTDIDAVSLKLGYSFGGILALPSNCRIDAFSSGDDSVFGSRIITVKKLK